MYGIRGGEHSNNTADGQMTASGAQSEQQQQEGTMLEKGKK